MRECTYKKFQLSYIECTHVIAMTRFQNLSDCYQYVSKYYLTNYWKLVYEKNVKPLKDLFEWEHPEELPTVLSPLMFRPPIGT